MDNVERRRRVCNELKQCFDYQEMGIDNLFKDPGVAI